MSMEALNNSLSSLVDENLFGGEMETEELLLRRLSPYATLRPGDFSVLFGISQPQSGDHSNRVYVDPRILPGFRYRVRHVGTENYLFDGRALTLQSIGLGYGKRLTFTGDSLNFNDNYFWSDSDPNGFAFSLDAVQPADRLTVYGNDGSGIIGEVKVERVPRIQEEISSKMVNGDVIKRVRVVLDCNVTYYQRQQGMVNLKLHDIERMTGEATVVKRKRSRVATLDCIHDVTLACFPGTCTLQVEP